MVYKAPDVFIKTAELATNFQKSLGIGNRRTNLQAVANNAGVIHKGSKFLLVVPGNFHWIETIESFAIVFPLLKNCLPAQSSLGALEDQKLKQDSVIVLWNAPLCVVVGD